MTHDEIIDGLHMASGIVQNRRMLLQGKTHGRDLSPTELCLDSSYTSAINACAAATAAQAEIQRLTAERDALAAKLDAIERAEPVAVVAPDWQLFWAGAEPISVLLKRNPGVRIGSGLYAHPHPPAAAPGDQRVSRTDELRQPLTYEQLDAIADAHRWDTREGRRELMRAAIARAVKGSAA